MSSSFEDRIRDHFGGEVPGPPPPTGARGPGPRGGSAYLLVGVIYLVAVRWGPLLAFLIGLWVGLVW